MSNLFRNLKKMRRLQPDANFAFHSKTAILSVAKKPHYQVLFQKQLRQVGILGMAMGMAVILLFVLSNVSHLRLNGLSQNLLTSLNTNDLNTEKNNAGFKIQLAEAKYYKESTNQITMAIGSVFNGDNNFVDADNIRKQAKSIDLLIDGL